MIKNIVCIHIRFVQKQMGIWRIGCDDENFDLDGKYAARLDPPGADLG